MYRTHTCGELRLSLKGKTVTLAGWVHQKRNLGNLIFVVLRDRHGLTQIVFGPEMDKKIREVADGLKSEYVVQLTGEVRPRMKGQENKAMPTGDIEIYASEIKVLNESKTLPFEIDQEKSVGEEIRLKYRYLDIRHPRLRHNLVLRHQMIKTIRDILDDEGFIEVETPILIKGTPEGSREYLVPSRLYPGKFFVLPQSPQQLKQLLMIGGLDRYFQVARCFRDEDQRGDRQPEFTQLDLEMSFVEEKDLMAISDKMMLELVKRYAPDKKILRVPFPIITWYEAMSKYGSDKPDIRFGMEFTDISDIVEKSGFKVFSETVKKGGVVEALRVPGAASWTRSDFDALEEVAKTHGAKGLAYFVYKDDGIKSTLTKFLSEAEITAITKTTGAKTGDAVFFAADQFTAACTALGHVRLACGDKLRLRDPNVFAFLWVNQFPMFEKDKESGGLAAMHHPFTRPMDEDHKLLGSTPENARAVAYDIVLNGVEIGGGSLRIHEPDLQKRIFDILNISDADAERRFGHMLEAFSYGAPPHGGFAWGLDRLFMIFCGEQNIREVIAFPKDQKAKDLTLGAPSEVTEKELKEANILIRKTN